MKGWFILLAGLLWGATVSAEGPEAVVAPAVHPYAHRADSPFFMTQVSIVTPSTLTLLTERFEVPYSENLSGLPSFQLGLGFPLGLVGPVEVQGIAWGGYSFKDGLFSFRTRDGSETLRDAVRLHRVPLGAGARLLYHIPWLSFVKPTLTVGLGAQWLYQSAATPGLTQGFWIPYYVVAPALTFFETTDLYDWFGGFTFGISYQNDVESPQDLRAWSFDLSVNLRL